ncbi:MAG: YciI family protein [Micrococcales bacterium]
MTVYAVNYFYNDDKETQDALRAEHRSWLRDQLADGNLLASGPLVAQEPIALLIWRSEDIESLNGLLNQDPFQIAGVVKETTITEWNAIIGPFEGK